MTEHLEPPTKDSRLTAAAGIFSLVEQSWRSYYTVPEVFRPATPEEFSEASIRKLVDEDCIDAEIAKAINETAYLVVRKEVELGLLTPSLQPIQSDAETRKLG